MLCLKSRVNKLLPVLNDKTKTLHNWSQFRGQDTFFFKDCDPEQDIREEEVSRCLTHLSLSCQTCTDYEWKLRKLKLQEIQAQQLDSSNRRKLDSDAFEGKPVWSTTQGFHRSLITITHLMISIPYWFAMLTDLCMKSRNSRINKCFPWIIFSLHTPYQ